jgi:dihydrofolate reductase
MRRLVVTALVSLDGVVSAPERLLPLWDEENKRYAVSELTEFDALLFGRVTYEAFAARWPAIHDDEFGDTLNRLPKYVASRSLRDTTWTGSSLLRGDVAAAIADLKQRPGKHILKYGFGELDKTLFQHQLIDELRVSLVPVIIGSGRRLLDGVERHSHSQLRLAHAHPFSNGIIRLTYTLIP